MVVTIEKIENGFLIRYGDKIYTAQSLNGIMEIIRKTLFADVPIEPISHQAKLIAHPKR